MHGKSDRYCSHSWEPNCEYRIVMLDCDEMVVVLVRAIIDIKAGSELTVNYDWGEDSTTPTKCVNVAQQVIPATWEFVIKVCVRAVMYY